MDRALLLFLLGAVAACAHFPPFVSASGTIRGLVLTQPELQPVVGATITLARRRATATTDSNGTFQFTNVPAGSYALNLHAGSVAAGALRDVVVGKGDSTCVLFLSEPLRNSPVAQLQTGPVTDPLLVLNGAVRFPASDSSAAAGNAQPRVIQIRNPWALANFTWRQLRPDSATLYYGRRASLGALLINTTPQASCSLPGP
jgi:hypothetical protein